MNVKKVVLVVGLLALVGGAWTKVASAETKTIDLLPGELWWGGTVGGGWRMPVGEKGREVKDLRVDSDGNQSAPLLLSTKGRWVWCEDAFKYTIEGGKLTVETGPASGNDRTAPSSGCGKALRSQFPLRETIVASISINVVIFRLSFIAMYDVTNQIVQAPKSKRAQLS